MRTMITRGLGARILGGPETDSKLWALRSVWRVGAHATPVSPRCESFDRSPALVASCPLAVKSIADFIEGKIVRLELEDEVSFARGGEPHPELGECEGTLAGPGGEALFYQRGMTVGERALAYDRIQRVEISPLAEGRRSIAISLDGETVMLRSSDTGGEVLHAALRWIGHTMLRRKIAD